MNRIAEIKERLQYNKYECKWRDQMFELEEDVEYLLAKLEIAEKALEELHRYTTPEYPFKSADTIAEFHTLTNIALKAIRE